MTPKTWTLTLAETGEQRTIAHEDLPAALRGMVYGATAPSADAERAEHAERFAA